MRSAVGKLGDKRPLRLLGSTEKRFWDGGFNLTENLKRRKILHQRYDCLGNQRICARSWAGCLKNRCDGPVGCRSLACNLGKRPVEWQNHPLPLPPYVRPRLNQIKISVVDVKTQVHIKKLIETGGHEGAGNSSGFGHEGYGRKLVLGR